MKRKIVIQAALALTFTFGFYSCEMLDFSDIIGDNDKEVTVESLRNEILKLSENARADCDNEDNDPAVREQLNGLIEDIIALSPQGNEFEQLDRIVGSWQQVWSDTEFTSIPGLCFEAEDIYQVVFEDGFYYNIAEVRAFGAVFTDFTRGAYEVDSDFLPVVFTNNFFVEGGLVSGTDLEVIALQAENGELTPADVPIFPLDGTTGRLRNLYVDEELRIITDGSPVSESNGIFVLQRIATVP